jgi:uncharacterized protein
MFFSIQALELRNVEFDEQYAPGALDLGPEVRQTAPLKAAGYAALVEEHHGRRGPIQDIRVVGRLSTQVELLCARCLEPVAHGLERSFDLLHRPQGTDAGVEEIAVGPAEIDMGYYQGEGLQLEDLLREQVLLAVPLREVCREDCKGLCPQCGRNLNVETCQCPPPAGDARWAALEEFKKKLEH